MQKRPEANRGFPAELYGCDCSRKATGGRKEIRLPHRFLNAKLSNKEDQRPIAKSLKGAKPYQSTKRQHRHSVYL